MGGLCRLWVDVTIAYLLNAGEGWLYMYMLNPAYTLATLQKNVIVSCDQLGETFRAAPTLLRRGPAFSEDIPTLSTQPRANPTPSDHVTPLQARSQAPRTHSLGSNCTRTNDPYLHKKRFSFA